jgi:4-hydroxy-tetrahydrodipicolinate reductase
MTLSIAIAGAAGRMGQALIRAAVADARFRVVGATKHARTPELGAPGVTITADVCAAAGGAAVWIDFTTPAATAAAVAALAQTPVRAAIIGTTGLSSDEEQAIAASASRIAIVRSGNFSLGVNLLAALVRQAAARLGAGWDIEITEAHHRRKVDAPSGAALLLGDAAAQGRSASLAELRLPPRDGLTGERREGGIGFSVSRGGGIVGDHAVRFVAEREVVTLSHRALERAVFADGALAAALWAAAKPPGLYSMSDVLGL